MYRNIVPYLKKFGKNPVTGEVNTIFCVIIFLLTVRPWNSSAQLGGSKVSKLTLFNIFNISFLTFLFLTFLTFQWVKKLMFLFKNICNLLDKNIFTIVYRKHIPSWKLAFWDHNYIRKIVKKNSLSWKFIALHCCFLPASQSQRTD